MRTRRDQVQAYRFVSRRLVSAMLSGEPETTNLPMRRLLLAVIGSVMIAAVVFAGIGAWALLHPGGKTSWKKDLTLVIERETGARFVYLDGLLHPVLNYASARLIVGSANPVQETASRVSLAGTPRSQPVGIPGAPDAVPDAKRLLGMPWTVCSAPRVAGTADLATQVLIGGAPSAGAALGSDGLLVSVGHNIYLLWADHRLRVPDKTTLAALGMTGYAPLPAGQSLIDGIPAGPDLAAPSIAGAGGLGPPVAGRAARIGDVFRAANQSYVLLADGLAPVHEVTAKLLNTSSRTPIMISAAEAAAVLSETKVEPDGLPRTAPTLRQLDTRQPAVCAGYRGDEAHPVTIEVYATPPARFAVGPDRDVVTGRDSVRTADRVVVPGGHGALVQAQPAPGVPASGPAYLVTDQGVKFALAGNAREALGFAGVQPVPVPAALLALVPTGPALDPALASRPATMASVADPNVPAGPPPAPMSSPALGSASPGGSPGQRRN